MVRLELKLTMVDSGDVTVLVTYHESVDDAEEYQLQLSDFFEGVASGQQTISGKLHRIGDKRRAALDELSELSEEAGGYDEID